MSFYFFSHFLKNSPSLFAVPVSWNFKTFCTSDIRFGCGFRAAAISGLMELSSLVAKISSGNSNLEIVTSGVFALDCTNMSLVGIESWNYSYTVWLGSVCILDRKSAASFAFPGKCARTILNDRTLSKKFQIDGGMNFVGKNEVKLLLSVRIITGFLHTHIQWEKV